MISEIFKCVCIATGLEKDEIICSHRYSYAADARYMLYALCRKINPRENTLQFIGNFVGRDHSTIIRGLKQHENNYTTDKYYKKCFDEALTIYEDLINSIVIERKEDVIDTPYGKRLAQITVRYNKNESL